MRTLTNEMNGVHDGRPVIKNQFINRTLAVLTSGGDSPGMNSAVRAIVRMGIYLGCKVYLIHEVYKLTARKSFISVSLINHLLFLRDIKV